MESWRLVIKFRLNILNTYLPMEYKSVSDINISKHLVPSI